MSGPVWLVVPESGPAVSTTNPLPVTGGGTAALPSVVVEQAPALTANSVTITNGTALSAALAVPTGAVVRGLVTPAAWTSAALTFDVSQDGTNFESLRGPDGAEFSISPMPVSAYVPFPTILGVAKIKLRSGISGTTVNQGADRVFSVVTG